MKLRNRFKTAGLVALPVIAGMGALLGLLNAQSPAAASQPTPNATAVDVDRGAAGIVRWLHALQTRASILHVTAHPDDEDGGMLVQQTRGVGARGILLTLNRGEGGQNAMSPDMYDALGLVRTQELLAADRYYGVDQYWTRTADYGFSKTREEALDKWSHDRTLADVVRVIRMTRPLVITSVFAGAATDGHGNHQVAGQMAQEAYKAAGDPKMFPEQLQEGLRPWTPVKVYARVPFFAVTPQGMYDYAIDKFVPVRFYDYVNEKWSDKSPSTNVEIPEGDFAPAAGLSFLQIGRMGLAYQKSQNSGAAMGFPGPSDTAYHRYASRVQVPEHEETFYDGVDVSVNGIGSLVQNEPDFLKKGLAEIADLARNASAAYRPDRPNDIAPTLADGLKTTRALLDQVHSSNLAEPGKSDVAFELGMKEKQFQNALTEALGLSVEAAVAPDKEPPAGRGFGRGAGPLFTIAIPGQAFTVSVQVSNSGTEPVNLESANLHPSDGKQWQIAPRGESPKSVAARQDARVRFAVTAPADAQITRPYFTRPDDEQAYYDIKDQRYRNLPLAPYPLATDVRVSYKGVSFPIAEVVQTTQRIPGLGIQSEPLIVAPAISVTLSPSAGAVPIGTKSFAFSCTIHSNVKGAAQGTLKLKLPAGWKSTPASAPFAMTRDGEDHNVTFSVVPDNVKPGDYNITAVAEFQGKTYEEGYKLVGYPGLRPYPLYRPAVYKAVGVDVKTASGLKIGFLPGTGDDVPHALEDLGQNVRVLASSDITQGDLGGYDAIILGARAYAVRSELKAANNRLLEYVKNGGVLIVQYNLQDFDHDYGPYPFSLGDNPQKVVDESSKVQLLDPKNPAFTWPNKITEADFTGWVEERGHGFMATWDPRYTPLVEMHDPEQDPQKGGLLLAHYGKGAYVYDSLALYRQLPSGVPGAFRILANLISLGKNPEFQKAATSTAANR